MGMTPPPFNPTEAPKQRRSSGGPKVVLLILFLVCVPCIGLIAVAGYFGFRMVGKGMNIASCAIGFTDVRDAIMTYANAHDGTLPNAKTWQTDVKPYYTKVAATHKDMGPIKIMPAAGPWGCEIEDGKMTGIAFNSALSGKKLKDIENPYATVLIYEIATPSPNAHGVYEIRPKSSGPLFFGQHREWITIAVQGQSNFGEEGMNFDAPSGSSMSTSGGSPKPSSSTSSGF